MTNAIPTNLVERSIEHVESPALDWLYAKSLNLDHHDLVLLDGNLVIALMESNRITPHADVDGWVAEAWNTGEFNAHGKTVKEAVLRCFLWKTIGYKVLIPKTFIY